MHTNTNTNKQGQMVFGYVEPTLFDTMREHYLLQAPAHDDDDGDDDIDDDDDDDADA